jgi:peptide deformylase
MRRASHLIESWFMAVRPLVFFPAQSLRVAAVAVTDFDQKLADLVDDLRDTMQAVSAVGITAPHIGIALRVALIALTPEEDLRVYINPRLIAASSEMARNEEGSVSMPGVSEQIERPKALEIAYQDIAGHHQTETASGWLAVCLQHEIDQLDGIFWIQRLSAIKRERLLKKYEKLRRQG